MEIKSSDYHFKSFVYGLSIVLIVPFLIFGYTVIRFGNLNEVTEVISQNSEGVIGTFIFEFLILIILMWVKYNYSLITVDKERMIIHGRKGDEIIEWSNIESIKLYRADYRGAFVKVKLKNGKNFYTNTDLPEMEGNLLNPNYHPTFSTNMAELLKSKKKELST